jgi:hypothetical protein
MVYKLQTFSQEDKIAVAVGVGTRATVQSNQQEAGSLWDREEFTVRIMIEEVRYECVECVLLHNSTDGVYTPRAKLLPNFTD